MDPLSTYRAGGNAALVESGAQSLDEGVDILGREELAVATDARGIVEEGDEAGLDRQCR